MEIVKIHLQPVLGLLAVTHCKTYREMIIVKVSCSQRVLIPGQEEDWTQSDKL